MGTGFALGGLLGADYGDWGRDGRGILVDLVCLLTSILLRQCASLMDASFAQALEMVH